ncbi:type II secretion system F family protein [Nocardioides alcanivorans]|uniref:type II secretion system F family protein n=1 Tax=Nocardioides alcanivorans TaxID=2897352 RepID=UPI001F3C3379|nr:type II secretion system F family protein [Nocardioides alcanivorans]
MRPRLRMLAGGLVASLATATVLLGATAPASAADELVISHAQAAGDDLAMIVSVPGGTKVSPDDVRVTIAGQPADTSAELAQDATETIERITVLAIDTSNSMVNADRFEPAKAAATAFLDAAPADVRIGVVTFDNDVVVELAPSTDRDRAKAVIEGLTTARNTALNNGVIEAVAAAGDQGARQVLVLSDGKDTTDTSDESVVEAITASGVQVDVVALDQSPADLGPLQSFADAGHGAVIEATTEALGAAFDAEAETLSRQIVVTASIPSNVTAREGTVEVTAGELTASRLVYLRTGTETPTLPASDKQESSSLQVPKSAMYAGLAALGVGLLVLLGGVMYTATAPKAAPTAEERISAYGVMTETAVSKTEGGPALSLDQAKGAAAKVLNRNKGLEERISARLVQAGSSMKAAEWILLHGGLTIGGGLVGVLLGGGDLVVLLLALLAGALVPWLWLGFKRKKRLDAFQSSLADTLTLLSGSLSAGMSLAQSIDTVVQEGNEPIAGEFKQVLMEARLGVPLEDALDQVAERYQSKDFAWVIMAIRIQRQVGGNLAELLNTVAATLRERDYLRRQVKTLSAEGRLSGWILGLLPVAMFCYLLLTRRDYVRPLYTEFLGIVMLAAACALLALGAFMISRLVKVEV